MNSIRVYYIVNNKEKYEEFQPNFYYYDSIRRVDDYSMWKNATQYADCLKQAGIKHIELRWSP